jgi:hypothetical protein
MNPDIASIPIRDIHLPESVSWWPLAPGWWITLGLLVLAAAVVYILKVVKERRQLAKQSMEEFSLLVSRYQQDRDARNLLSNISQLLRRISITQYEERDVAGLTGTAWLQFLDETMEGKKSGRATSFNSELGGYLIAAQYQKASAVDEKKLDQLLVLSKAWLQSASSKRSAYLGKDNANYSEVNN